MRIRTFIHAIVAAATLAVSCPPVHAQDNSVATGTYRITFLGIPFGTTRYTGRFDPATYAATADFETSSLVSVFWKATIKAKVNGAYDAKHIRPAYYDADYRGGKDKHQHVTLTTADGKTQLVADPPYSVTKFPVTKEQIAEGVDPMSAVTLILLGLKSDKTHPCGTVAPVYDGRRRYDIELLPMRAEKFKLRGIHDGTAYLCQIRYKQIAGYKQKILEEGKRWPAIYGYFAHIPSAVAPQGYYVAALKVWADTDWGRLAVTLVDRDLKETPAP